MTMRIAQVALLVREYDEAMRFYVDRIGFRCVEDTPLAGGKRWVRLAPPRAPNVAGAAGVSGAGIPSGAELLLSRAATPEQLARVGSQTGGRVLFFLETDDLRRDYEAMSRCGVIFTEPPREESYGRVAVFVDLYGNRIDLIEPRRGTV